VTTNDIRGLRATLDETIGLLSDVGEHFWMRYLEHGRRQVAHGDAHGVDHLLGAFGGMGSFNDLVLDPLNQHQGTPEALASANRRLAELRSAIYDSCNRLKRDPIER
jgi:hypothetical protein